MRTAFALTACMLLVCACTSDGASGVPATGSGSTSTRQPQATSALEQLPSQLSLEYFGSMRLEGTDFMLGSPVAEHAEYTRYNISYRSNGLLITGIMNIPKGNGPFPLLVFNHGYIDPAVYTRGRGLQREQDYMARQGFAVLHTDYRGHAGSQPSPMTDKVYDGNVEYAMDSANAIDAVRRAALPTVDANRVGMLGHSMGGGVTLAILTARPDLVDAAVLYAPVHADVWENFSRWRSKREEGDRTVEQFGTREQNPTWWNGLSPQTYLAAIRAPVLLFQGKKDADVPAEWSDALAEGLRDLDKEFRYVAYASEGHEFTTEWQDFMQQTTSFFRQRLGQP